MDAAVPHLKGLLAENFDAQPGREDPVIEINASGHGYADTTKQLYRQCQVTILNHGYKQLCF